MQIKWEQIATVYKDNINVIGSFAQAVRYTERQKRLVQFITETHKTEIKNKQNIIPLHLLDLVKILVDPQDKDKAPLDVVEKLKELISKESTFFSLILFLRKNGDILDAEIVGEMHKFQNTCQWVLALLEKLDTILRRITAENSIVLVKILIEVFNRNPTLQSKEKVEELYEMFAHLESNNLIPTVFPLLAANVVDILEIIYLVNNFTEKRLFQYSSTILSDAMRPEMLPFIRAMRSADKPLSKNMCTIIGGKLEETKNFRDLCIEILTQFPNIMRGNFNLLFEELSWSAEAIEVMDLFIRNKKFNESYIIYFASANICKILLILLRSEVELVDTEILAKIFKADPANEVVERYEFLETNKILTKTNANNLLQKAISSEHTVLFSQVSKMVECSEQDRLDIWGDLTTLSIQAITKLTPICEVLAKTDFINIVILRELFAVKPAYFTRIFEILEQLNTHELLTLTTYNKLLTQVKSKITIEDKERLKVSDIQIEENKNGITYKLFDTVEVFTRNDEAFISKGPAEIIKVLSTKTNQHVYDLTVMPKRINTEKALTREQKYTVWQKVADSRPSTVCKSLFFTYPSGNESKIRLLTVKSPTIALSELVDFSDLNAMPFFKKIEAILPSLHCLDEFHTAGRVKGDIRLSNVHWDPKNEILTLPDNASAHKLKEKKYKIVIPSLYHDSTLSQRLDTELTNAYKECDDIYALGKVFKESIFSAIYLKLPENRSLQEKAITNLLDNMLDENNKVRCTAFTLCGYCVAIIESIDSLDENKLQEITEDNLLNSKFDEDDIIAGHTEIAAMAIG